MAKFRFDRIMEVKGRLLEKKEKELKDSLLELDIINNNINVIESEISTQYDILTSSTLNSNDFNVITDYLDYLDRKKQGLFSDRERVASEVAGLRAELVEVARELKILENLKSKTERAIHKAENRKEQKNLDDIALRIEQRRL